LSYSPLLSIVTALFELAVIVWALLWGKNNKITFASCAILLLLSSFQILEVFGCINPEGAVSFSRMGFLIITWLPALGIMLICFLFPYRSLFLLRVVQIMLLIAFLLNLWILTDDTFLQGTVCRIVFAQYDSPMPQFLIFGAYYQSGLLGMLLISVLGIIRSSDHQQRIKLGQIHLGTLLFVLPSMLLVIAFPAARNTLTSVLCHFAVILAVFLARLIYLEKRTL
jgi:hypothetical protein